MTDYRNIGLTNRDIMKLVEGRSNLVIYSQITRFRSLRELLGSYGCCFLLYEARPHHGHWCLIHKREDGVIEFFDPYGVYIDNELNKLSKRTRIETNQTYPWLTKLLYDYKGEIEYNHYRFQKLRNDIKTCGRWCVVRLWYRGYNLEEFHDLFKGKDGDSIVTKLTDWIYG